VDMRKVLQVAEEQTGMPTDITRGAGDGGGLSLSQQNY
jgi:hypothetical protein